MEDEPEDAIRRKPLRNPGQSLERELDELLTSKGAPWVAAIVFVVMLAGYEWVRWAMRDRFHPVFLTVLAGIVVVFALRKVRQAIKLAKRIRTGLAGERYVGNFLQNWLLRKGYWVIHDIVDDAGNIDHAVIGPGGVFSVETKTRTKRKGENKVTYDGTQILVNGVPPDRDPVIQAKASAKSLQRVLRDYTGTTVDVRPVVLFPEWYVESQSRGIETWVLNE